MGQKKVEKTQMNNIVCEKGGITVDTNKIQKIGGYVKKSYSKRIEKYSIDKYLLKLSRKEKNEYVRNKQ